MTDNPSKPSRIWPNQKVEPVIITYNRSQYLEKTLRAFLNAGLTTMKLHVLDNCSSDDTGEIVRKFQACWPLLTYHRNRYNINGNGNYLRALEIGDADYCWIIGDDDEWYLDGLEELLMVLEEGCADIIRLGWQISEQERGTLISLADLAKTNNQFFGSVSMISSIIVKREFITSDMSQCYFTIGDAYPQLVPFFNNYNSDQLQVYSLSKNIMQHTPSLEAGYYLADLEWLACFCRATRHLKDQVIRKKSIRGLMEYLTVHTNTPGSFLENIKVLLFYSLKSKAYGFNQIPYFFTLLGYGIGLRWHVVTAFFIYMCFPLFLLRPIIRLARKNKGLDDDLEAVRRHFLNGRENRP